MKVAVCDDNAEYIKSIVENLNGLNDPNIECDTYCYAFNGFGFARLFFCTKFMGNVFLGNYPRNRCRCDRCSA